ncbi:MAG: transporter, partial [Acidobacteriota bacterium]|nr:transporter [Acidobacteriota bacterium]
MNLLQAQPVVVLFVTLGCGYLLGGFSIGGVKLGSITGVLLIALFLGHLGMRAMPEVQQVGFILFVYSIGFQAGPRFFSLLAREGKRYLAFTLVMVLSAVGATVVLALLLPLQAGVPAGILAGALTSTPTLAAAQDAVASGVAYLPAGLTAAELHDNITVSYALTYVFGTAGLLLLIGALPRVFGIDLARAARDAEREYGAEEQE